MKYNFRDVFSTLKKGYTPETSVQLWSVLIDKFNLTLCDNCFVNYQHNLS